MDETRGLSSRARDAKQIP